MPTNCGLEFNLLLGGFMRYPARSLPSQSDRIAMFSGRPARTESITKDDVLNLIIALETHPDVGEFCVDKHLFSSKP
jgi:hypothetical protein